MYRSFKVCQHWREQVRKSYFKRADTGRSERAIDFVAKTSKKKKKKNDRVEIENRILEKLTNFKMSWSIGMKIAGAYRARVTL